MNNPAAEPRGINSKKGNKKNPVSPVFLFPLIELIF